ncbi:MAG TPA: GNAT family N-acetyltransferase [bacterium]|nr:GNAT family N-acetyltransferase [bacterium]
MEKIKIRKAQKQDAQTIIDFNRSMALETEDKDLDFRTISRGVKAVLEDKNKGFYLIAEIDGQAVGSLMITFEWSDWRNGFFWWIQSVYVVKEQRRQGAYTALHKKVRDLARQNDDVIGFRLYVEKNNISAQKTYEKIGMQPTYYKMYEEMK